MKVNSRRLAFGLVCGLAAGIWLATHTGSAFAFDQTDLVIWLDAADIDGDGNTSIVDEPVQGASIGLWVDKSGNGNNAITGEVPFPPQPSAPIMERTSSDLPGSLPAVRFNTCNPPGFPNCMDGPTQTGMDTRFFAHPSMDGTPVSGETAGDPNLVAKPNLTVAAVVNPTVINAYHMIWGFDDKVDSGAGDNRMLGVNHIFAAGPPEVLGKSGYLADGGGPRVRIPFRNDPNDPNDDGDFPNGFAGADVIIATYDFDGVNPYKINVNGSSFESPGPEQVGNGPGGIPPDDVEPLILGYFPPNPNNGGNITMLLSELVIFERTLDADEINALGFELAEKYGIPTAFNDPGGGVTGDYNGNDVVDAADYTLYRDNLGQDSSLLLNNDIPGTITTLHYDQWVSNFSNSGSGGGSSATAIPEPAGAMLVIIGLARLVVGRSRHPK